MNNPATREHRLAEKLMPIPPRSKICNHSTDCDDNHFLNHNFLAFVRIVFSVLESNYI